MKKTRLHPSVIFENVISSLAIIGVIAFSIITQLLEDFSGESLNEATNFVFSLGFGPILIVVLVIVILLLLSALIYFIIWKNTYLSFNNENLIIERGKLFKKVITIHLSDIATINIKRNIIQQFIGTADIKFDLHTSSSETYKGKLIFKEDKALEIRRNILDVLGRNDEALTLADKEEDKVICIYSIFDIIRHLFLSINIVSVFILVVVYLGVITCAMMSDGANGSLLTIFLIIILGLPLITSVVKSILKLCDFSCTRDGDNIKLSYGALTTYKYNLPVSKINAVIVSQTLQARLLNYYLLEIVNAGMGDAEDEKTIISLYVKESEKDRLLAELLPEFNNDVVLKSENINSFWHYLASKVLWIILCVILAFFTYGLSLILVLILLLMAFLQYRFKKIGYDDNMIIMVNGIINKKIVMVKFDSVEIISSHEKLFSQLFGTCFLELDVVGPAANSVFVSGLFDRNLILEIMKRY